MPYGTLAIPDTLASNRTLIALYGQDKAFEDIALYLQAHNEITSMMLGDLVEYSTDRLRRYGGVDQMEMIEGDEYSSAEAQKIAAGVNVGFPLKLFQSAVQWTRNYLKTHTVAEMAAQVQAGMTADLRRIQSEVKKAIFVPTNNLNYVDRLVDNSSRITLPLRALVNADGSAIPADPYGNLFDGNVHTHYVGTAALSAADVTALIGLVLEHYNVGEIKLYINLAQDAAVRAMPGFVPYTDARIINATTLTVGAEKLDIMNPYNRAIGVFGAAEVWVKPWLPSGYMFAFNPSAPKPLVFRTRDEGGGQFGIAAEYDSYPLQAENMEREFGVGVFERTNGACLDTQHATYQTPGSL